MMDVRTQASLRDPVPRIIQHFAPREVGTQSTTLVCCAAVEALIDDWGWLSNLAFSITSEEIYVCYLYGAQTRGRSGCMPVQ